MSAITWVPVACSVANAIVGAEGVVISRGRTDVTEGAFREYATATDVPVLREWTSLPANAPCRHEVPVGDGWLAQHDAEVRTAALHAAADALPESTSPLGGPLAISPAVRARVQEWLRAQAGGAA